jgi:hypothetical protein
LTAHLATIVAGFCRRLLGRTSDKKEHNLSVKDLKQLVGDFNKVAAAMARFYLNLLQLPKPHAPNDGQS